MLFRVYRSVRFGSVLFYSETAAVFLYAFPLINFFRSLCRNIHFFLFVFVPKLILHNKKWELLSEIRTIKEQRNVVHADTDHRLNACRKNAAYGCAMAAAHYQSNLQFIHYYEQAYNGFTKNISKRIRDWNFQISATNWYWFEYRKINITFIFDHIKWWIVCSRLVWWEFVIRHGLLIFISQYVENWKLHTE